MCVNDYQFRHFSASRDTVCRRFIVVDEDDFARTYLVNISQFEEFGDVGLCKILIYLSSKGLNIKNRKFFLPKFNAIIQPYTFCHILFEALDQKQILIKSYSSQKSSEDIFEQNEGIDLKQQNQLSDQQNYYCRFQEIDNVEDIFQMLKQQSQESKISENSIQEETVQEENPRQERMIDENDQKSAEKSEQSLKKIKETQRGIAQVIFAVKVWRTLYETKKCNLTKAAKIVGISKKSLDDYYLVLRVGQILGFNYLLNLEGKMGDLRNFIRLQQQKVTGKLGKNVQCFKLVQQVNIAKLLYQFQLKEAQ